MVIFSADISLTSTGWAIGRDGNVASSGHISGRGDGMDRMIRQRDAVCREIDAAEPNLIVFEDFSFGSNMAYAREIAGLTYMIRAEIHQDAMCSYVCVSPMALKKYCVGTAGNAKAKVGKEHILKGVLQRFGHDVSSHDQADALVLCHIGMALVGDEQPTIEPQKQVLAALRTKDKWLSKFYPVESEF